MRAWSASAPYPEFPSVPVVHAALVRLYLILTTLAPHQISYTGESDSQLTKGLAALLVRGLSLSISLPPAPPHDLSRFFFAGVDATVAWHVVQPHSSAAWPEKVSLVDSTPCTLVRRIKWMAGLSSELMERWGAGLSGNTPDMIAAVSPEFIKEAGLAVHPIPTEAIILTKDISV